MQERVAGAEIQFKFEAKLYLITKLGTIIGLDFDFRNRVVT